MTKIKANNTKEKQLTRLELEMMQILWKIDRGFLSEIIENIPEPRPAYTTVSSMMRILVEKGFANYETFGKSFRYYPIISKEEYANFFLKGAKTSFFDGSAISLLSFFVKKERLSDKEREELIAIINDKE